MLQPLRNFIMRVAYLGLRATWVLLRPVTVGVRIMLIQDERVLLIKQTYTTGWHFPGGLVDRGELLREAAEREN